MQPRPALVDNYRSWMEQYKSAGAKAAFETTGTNAQPILTAINDTGFKPAFALLNQSIYNNKTVQAAKQVSNVPPTYINLQNVPWELADQFPTVALAKKLMTEQFGNRISMPSARWASTRGCCGHSRPPRAAIP